MSDTLRPAIRAWLQKLPGYFVGTTHTAAITAARDNFDPTHTADLADFGRIVRSMGYEPEQRHEHGDTPRTYWLLPIPGPGH